MPEADSADYPVVNISEQASIREVDRLYENLDNSVSFFSTLRDAVTVLGDMRDPSSSKLFEKIDRISREDAYKWKRSAAHRALADVDNHHPRM